MTSEKEQDRGPGRHAREAKEADDQNQHGYSQTIASYLCDQRRHSTLQGHPIICAFATRTMPMTKTRCKAKAFGAS